VFISLGAGAKILCVDLARELGIHAIDFGACMRSLCYAGSEGLRTARAPHHIYLFRIPFITYMNALNKAFPTLKNEEILAKAHAQLMHEFLNKEIGWSVPSWKFDFSKSNFQNFKISFLVYKNIYKKYKISSMELRRERAGFLHFCGKHRLTFEGCVFYFFFQLKNFFKNCLTKLIKSNL
jgi:hypothetical protein